MESKVEEKKINSNENEVSESKQPQLDKMGYKKSYAVILRKVFNLVETNPKTCYVGPLYSNQLYEFAMTSGEKIYGYVSSVEDVLKTYPRETLVDYAIVVNPVIDEMINKIDYNGFTIRMSAVSSVMKKHPLFADFGSGIDINPSMLREYTVFNVVVGGVKYDLNTYSLQKFRVKNRPVEASTIFGYLKTIQRVGNDTRLIVDAIRFYHGAVQRHDLYINLNDLVDITRQKIVIEEFVLPTPQKREKGWKKREIEENSKTESEDTQVGYVVSTTAKVVKTPKKPQDDQEETVETITSEETSIDL